MSLHLTARMDGCPLDALPWRLQVTDLREEVLYREARTARLPLKDGQWAAPPRRDALRVTLRIHIAETEPETRVRALRAVHRWACGGRLEVSTRPGCFLRTRCEALPEGSALLWADAVTLVLAAREVPFWEEGTEAVCMLQDGSGLLRVGGTAPCEAEAELTAEEAVDRAALQIGGETVAFEGLGLSAADRLVVGHTALGLRTAKVIRAGLSVPALGLLTADSGDGWRLLPGENPIRLDADGACAARVTARGRWL